MKAVANFLSFVEIKTKLASVIPFLAATGFTMYRIGKLDFYRTAIFFVAMIFFDMTTTAINNHVGTRQQKRGNHYSNGISLLIILVMLLISAFFGIYLVSITNTVVLLVGIICFGIGIFYSFGPLPIARTPFGEIFSGGAMGFFIPFLVYVINDPEILKINLMLPSVLLSIDLISILCICIFVIPIVCCISNIMLANNICDLEEDVKDKRYTLPYYIGKETCLKLFQWLYIIPFLSIAVGVVLDILPITSIIGLIFILPVIKNIRIFNKKQIKTETFDISIKNFIIILLPYTLGIWLPQIWLKVL